MGPPAQMNGRASRFCTSSSASWKGRLDDYQGYHLLNWTKAGLRYWLVSDLNLRDMRELAKLIQGIDVPRGTMPIAMCRGAEAQLCYCVLSGCT